MSHYRMITLAADVMFINRVAFFVTISRNLKFGTSEMIAGQKGGVLLNATKQVAAIYAKRGFVVSNIHMDGQFEVLRGGLSEMHITLNIAANDENVPEIERYIL